MKKSLLICTFFLLFSGIVCSQPAAKDSVMKVLQWSRSQQERLEALTNLMDISRGEDILKYGKELYHEALEAGDEYHKEAALTEIIRYYVNTDQKDSSQYYMAEAKRELHGEIKESLLTFMQMIIDTRIVFYTKGEERKQIIEDKFLALETDQNLSPYQKMAAYYVLGMVVGNAIQVDLSEKEFRDITYYFENVLEIAKKLPLRYSYQYQPNSYWMLCNFIPSLEERATYANQYLSLLNQYMETKEMKKRPFYNNKRSLLNVYGLLATLSPILGKDLAQTYYNRFLVLNKQYPECANVTPEYEYYMTSLNYYDGLRDYRKTIEFSDSLIAFFKKAHYEDNIISCVEKKIEMYDSLGMYKQAYQTYQEYTILLDTLHAQRLREQLEGLEIQKNVNNLVIEKKSLELKLHKSKSQTYLFLTLFVFSLSSIIYVILRLDKMKSLYKKIQESNQQLVVANEKAQESEKMKNAFIRNMYHEVRTPLNAINGFSELIANDHDLPSEDKQQFSRIIHENCILLTSMLDNVLKISQLDSSNEEIPLGPVNLHELCSEEMEKLQQFQKKETIEYRLETDPPHAVVQSNRTYLGLIITRLLSNATKFTDTGRITLSYSVDSKRHLLTLSVTDTGCGIPADKREWIFERFSKTNDFVPGSGLGLHLCQLISKRLKGDIQVDPTYTDGARFVVTIPI